MEGKQVGEQSPELSDQLALDLLWPTDLIIELSHARNRHPWGTALAVVTFIVAAILGLLVGPVQLVVLIISGDYLLATESFYPVALRISLLVSGLVALANLVAMFQTWREDNYDNISSAILGIGSSLITLLIWLVAFVIPIKAHILALIMFILIAATSISSLVVYYHTKDADLSTPNWLKIILAVVMALSLGESITAFIYVVTQSSSAEQSQIELQELGAAQAAARIDGVTQALSDLVFTLCAGPYEGIYLPSTLPDSGIFECKTSHRVFAVSGPDEVTGSRTDTVILGSAFYFGTTFDTAVSNAFPAETGAKYLYRDLSNTEYPSELILLLPAPDDEALIETYLPNLLTYLNNRPTRHPLLLSLFYTPELNTVVATKDYILLTAADTISLNDFLPDGNRLTGYLNDKRGAYIYIADTALTALQELGASPLLYSSQTYDAIMNRRHITVLLTDTNDYSADQLRELLYQGLLEPKGGSQAEAETITESDSETEPESEPAE